MLRFLALFASGAALVLCWSFLESYFIKRLTLAFQMKIAIPLTSLILLILIAMLGLHVWLRLNGAARISASDPLASSEPAAGRSLLRLPWELFVWTVCYAVFAIPAYHIVHYALDGHSLLNVGASYWQNFIRSFMYELCVGTSAAILYYSVGRRLIRPALAGMTHAQGAGIGRRSFLTMLTTTFGALLMINMLSVLWYVWVADAKNEPFRWPVLLSLVGLEWGFAGAVLGLLASGFRRELQLLAGGLRELLRGDHGPSQPKMPVLAADEIGQLAVAFNRLHDRLGRDYDAVVRELRLARGLQLSLQPPSRQRFGAIALAVLNETRAEVGSGFCDAVPLAGGGLAALVGDVAGEGLPAALRMSAAMLLLRAELEGQDEPAASRESAPETALARFASQLKEIFPEEAELSAAVAFIDAAGGSIAIGMQGGMRGWLQRGGEGRSLKSGDSWRLRQGDRVCLYSEAAAEAAIIAASGETANSKAATVKSATDEADAAPEALLYETAGRTFAGLDPDEPLDGQLAEGLLRMRSAASTKSRGDANALLLVVREEGER